MHAHQQLLLQPPKPCSLCKLCSVHSSTSHQQCHQHNQRSEGRTEQTGWSMFTQPKATLLDSHHGMCGTNTLHSLSCLSPHSALHALGLTQVITAACILECRSPARGPRFQAL